MDGATLACIDKLASVEISTPGALLLRCAIAEDRSNIARRLELSERLLLIWVNKLDLMRVRGIGSDYCDLLRAAGVRSLRDLQHCTEPTELLERLVQVNRDAIKRSRRSIVRRTPSVTEVRRWIQLALDLDCMVEIG